MHWNTAFFFFSRKKPLLCHANKNSCHYTIHRFNLERLWTSWYHKYPSLSLWEPLWNEIRPWSYQILFVPAEACPDAFTELAVALALQALLRWKSLLNHKLCRELSQGLKCISVITAKGKTNLLLFISPTAAARRRVHAGSGDLAGRRGYFCSNLTGRMEFTMIYSFILSSFIASLA